MDFLFLVLYFSVLELPFFKYHFYFSVEIPYLFTHYDHFFLTILGHMYNSFFKVLVCSNIWITSGLFQPAHFFLEYWSDFPFAFTYLLVFDSTQDIVDHVL